MIRISVLSLFYSAHWIYTKLLHGMNMIKYVKIKCCVSSIELLKCQTIWQYRHYFCATVKAYQTVNRSFCMDGLFLPPKFIPPHDGQNKPLLPAPQLCSCHSNPLTNNSPCICTLKPWEADEMCPLQPLSQDTEQHPPSLPISLRHVSLRDYSETQERILKSRISVESVIYCVFTLTLASSMFSKDFNRQFNVRVKCLCIQIFLLRK